MLQASRLRRPENYRGLMSVTRVVEKPTLVLVGISLPARVGDALWDCVPDGLRFGAHEFRPDDPGILPGDLETDVFSFEDKGCIHLVSAPGLIDDLTQSGYRMTGAFLGKRSKMIQEVVAVFAYLGLSSLDTSWLMSRLSQCWGFASVTANDPAMIGGRRHTLHRLGFDSRQKAEQPQFCIQFDPAARGFWMLNKP